MNWLKGFSLDLKLGGRMLVKYPGLTIVGGLAMAFAICVGTVIFAVLTMLIYPTLPLPAGERASSGSGTGTSPPVECRAARAARLRRLARRAAVRDGARCLAGRQPQPYRRGPATRVPSRSAEITASGFRIAEDAPLLGRVLVAADERPDAPAVAVLGYDVWRTRFGNDPNVLGRTVQLGNEYTTVVGVMREGFAFPVSHELWMPLRTDILDQAPRSGPAVTVFGVLAPGVTLETAQAELTALGRRAAIERPATHEHLQPRVTPYAKLFSEP